MARPKAKELTERELEVMQVFWDHGEQAVTDARDRLAANGRDLAYTTVATLVRILMEKGFVRQTNDERPFRFVPVKSQSEVSGSLLKDLIHRVFDGSRMNLLARLLEEDKLTASERQKLRNILDSTKKG